MIDRLAAWALLLLLAAPLLAWLLLTGVLIGRSL
jgi:hypothetical protein